MYTFYSTPNTSKSNKPFCRGYRTTAWTTNNQREGKLSRKHRRPDRFGSKIHLPYTTRPAFYLYRYLYIYPSIMHPRINLSIIPSLFYPSTGQSVNLINLCLPINNQSIHLSLFLTLFIESTLTLEP